MAKINGPIISEYEIKKIKNLDFISKICKEKIIICKKKQCYQFLQFVDIKKLLKIICKVAILK